MNLLNRFERDVAMERSKDSEDYQQVAAECNRTISSISQKIESIGSERRNLVSSDMYRSIEGALNGAIENARSHYLNASSWAAKAAAQYLATGKQLEIANVKLQETEATHDAVLDSLNALASRVNAHKKEKFTSLTGTRAAEGHEARSSLFEVFAVVQNNLKDFQTPSENSSDLKELHNILHGLRRTRSPAVAWHDKVLDLSKAVAKAVSTSKMLRTEPLREEVHRLSKKYAQEGHEMKTAVRSKSLSKDALLQAKRSRGLIEDHREENKRKRMYLANATAHASENLQRATRRCNNYHKKWKEIDDSSEESLATIYEFLEDVNTRKKQQDIKLQRAVDMMTRRL